MKRILTVFLGWALSVSPALAAFNDVSLTTDAVLNIGGITLNVSGSTAVIQSITVNSGDFSVTLTPGSSMQVTAPGLERLSASTNVGISTDVCNTSRSVLGYEAVNQTVTVTITPSTTLCSSSGSGSSAVSTSTSTPSGSSNSIASESPAGGGSSSANATTATVPQAAPSFSGLSASQIQAVLDVLVSFGSDAETIAKVRTSLEGSGPGSVTSAAVVVFKLNLKTGSLGEEVRTLQKFLNARGYPIVSSGPGSPGQETTFFGPATRAALIKYQKAKGIEPAAGYFGPKTREVVNADQ